MPAVAHTGWRLAQSLVISRVLGFVAMPGAECGRRCSADRGGRGNAVLSAAMTHVRGPESSERQLA